MRFTGMLFPLLLVLLQPVMAQSVRFSVAGGTAGHVQVALLDQRVQGGRASLGLHFGEAPGLALHLRNVTTFGPLGNVIVDLDAAAGIRAGVDASLAARATAGPFALRLRSHVATAVGLPLLREDDGTFPARPRLKDSLVWGVQLGATYRASRELQLLLDPSLLAADQRLALLIPLEIQLQRFAGAHDLKLQVATLLPLTGGPAGLQAWSSAGLGIRIDRGRAAAWDAWLLLGGNGSFVSPGFRLAVQDSLAGGQLRAGLQLEPWRGELGAFLLRLGWTGPVTGTLLNLYLEARAPAGSLGAGIGITWQLD